ncbi:MAG TPA: hypothetical protein VIF57_29310 [Polyangia bacterium]|jgi:hypothetical protein
MLRATAAVLLLGVTGCTLFLTPPAQPSPPWRVIHILAGSYGQNCRAVHGNTTAQLAQNCEGQPSCAYRIDYTVIGDPAFGCAKDYVAEWRCGDDPTVLRAAAAPEAGFGSIIQLRCD